MDIGETITAELRTDSRSFDGAMAVLYDYMEMWRDWDIRSMMLTRPSIPGRPGGKYNMQLTLERRVPSGGTNARAPRNLGE